MKISIVLTVSLLINFSFSQSVNWNYYEIAKGFKIKTPDIMEKRVVRDLEIHQIEGGNYDWKIISMPLSSFLKDNDSANFLGQAKNMSNLLCQDPYTDKMEDSLFNILGYPVFWTQTSTVNPMDQSQNFKTIRFYMLKDRVVYVSNFKYFKESKIKKGNFDTFFEDMKLSKSKNELELNIEGEKSYFYTENKRNFLKEVYCGYPQIKKNKSYHKIMSLNVSLKLTETGIVKKVVLEPSKMILITRESEAELEKFFSKFKFNKAIKEREQEQYHFNFVLFLDDRSKKSYCK